MLLFDQICYFFVTTTSHTQRIWIVNTSGRHPKTTASVLHSCCVSLLLFHSTSRCSLRHVRFNPAAPEQLPQSWVLRFFELLPTHLKLKLRQCSRSLLDLVDGSTSSRLNVRLATLNWKLDFMVAAEVVFDLMCKNVVALDLSSLFVPDARCFGAVVANLSKAVPGAGAPILLPRLQHLTVRLSQVKLLSAIAAATAPCSVKQLSLWCCQACRLGHPAATSALGVEMVSIADTAHELASVGKCTVTNMPSSSSPWCCLTGT